VQSAGNMKDALLPRLFLLVAVVLLPAIAVQAYNEFDQRHLRQVELQDQALRLAKLPAAEHGQNGLDKTPTFTGIEHRTEHDILLILLATLLMLILTWLGTRSFVHRARELRDAEEKAEEAAARITTVFESTTDSVLIIDRDWRIVYGNERAKTQIADGRELIGMNLWVAFPSVSNMSFRVQFLAAMSEAAMSEQLAFSFETFCFRFDRWYVVNVFPSSEGLNLYFQDISEHKRAVEAHRLIEEQLHQSQKMEAIGQLTGGIAHDFNNLLTVIAGNLAFIEDRTGDNDTVRKFAAAARQAADRGAKLTAQLLAFSRQQNLKPESIYADHLIREFEGLIRRALEEKREFQLIADEQLWACRVDPTQLETALLNLALNGRDAMADGGLLKIDARNVIVQEGSVIGLAPGAYVSLAITDTGHGMAPETLDRVFEPFFTTKDVGKGTGLGLSMVHGFVKQSGGDITIASEVGVGTTVTLYLPRAAAPCHAEVTLVKKQAAATGSGRILVVEDDEQVLKVTSRMLTDLGYQVVSARNGADALEALKNGDGFDLLFSDIGMPHGMNGVELARAARRLGNGIKVLLTSGYADGVLERHQALDEFPMINKPFYTTDLARHVSSLLHEA
jgi:signal transduction histidine kinase/CheY-like chemotaxis protein